MPTLRRHTWRSRHWRVGLGVGSPLAHWRCGVGKFQNIAKTALRRVPVMKRELHWSPSHPLRLIQNHKAGNFTLADPHVCAGALSTTRLDAPDLISECRAPIDYMVVCGPCGAEAG